VPAVVAFAPVSVWSRLRFAALPGEPGVWVLTGVPAARLGEVLARLGVLGCRVVSCSEPNPLLDGRCAAVCFRCPRGVAARLARSVAAVVR
jgi:hypothetical protein